MYIKLPSTYPYNPARLRVENPDVSFPDQMPDERLADWGVFPVVLQTPPEVPNFKVLQEVLPIQIDTIYTQQWILRDRTPEEIDALTNDVRSMRTSLLQESDWTQVADAPVNKEAWAAYRQALRDVTTQSGFPTIIIWPVKPE